MYFACCIELKSASCCNNKHMDRKFLIVIFYHISFLLQKSQSTETELLLRSVDLDTTGLYRCEISGEAPLFQTAQREQVLAVVGK